MASKITNRHSRSNIFGSGETAVNVSLANLAAADPAETVTAARISKIQFFGSGQLKINRLTTQMFIAGTGAVGNAIVMDLSGKESDGVAPDLANTDQSINVICTDANSSFSIDVVKTSSWNSNYDLP
jgi:hypothetical protein